MSPTSATSVSKSACVVGSVAPIRARSDWRPRLRLTLLLLHRAADPIPVPDGLFGVTPIVRVRAGVRSDRWVSHTRTDRIICTAHRDRTVRVVVPDQVVTPGNGDIGGGVDVATEHLRCRCGERTVVVSWRIAGREPPRTTGNEVQHEMLDGARSCQVAAGCRHDGTWVTAVAQCTRSVASAGCARLIRLRARLVPVARHPTAHVAPATATTNRRQVDGNRCGRRGCNGLGRWRARRHCGRYRRRVVDAGASDVGASGDGAVEREAAMTVGTGGTGGGRDGGRRGRHRRGTRDRCRRHRTGPGHRAGGGRRGAIPAHGDHHGDDGESQHNGARERQPASVASHHLTLATRLRSSAVRRT